MTRASDDKLKHELLLVEDNPGDADYIVSLLGEQDPRQNDSVLRAQTLAEARSILDRSEVDAIILDLRLPDGDGVECVRRIRAVEPDVPIVVLTSIADERLALTCINEGAQDYLSKSDLRGQHLYRAIGYAIARASEATARRREEHLRTLLVGLVGSSADAIFSTTEDGVVNSWNPAATQLFGLDQEGVVGHSIDALAASHPIPAIAQIARLVDAMSSGERRQEIIRIARAGGETVASVLVSPLRHPSGVVLGRTVVCRDITELERRREELRRRNEDLEARDHQMRALTARLNAIREDEQSRIAREVHDKLGQMLTGIRLDLAWVERRLTSDTSATEVTERIRETTKLVDTTVETVHQIASGLRPAALDALGLGAAIRDEGRRFQRRSQIEVVSNVDETIDLDASVTINLYRIVQELLTNVARHANAQRVEIALQQSAEDVRLSVGDDGVGIRDEALSAPSSLGLLSVRERAASIGGDVRFERPAARGTFASVRIPREDIEPHA